MMNPAKEAAERSCRGSPELSADLSLRYLIHFPDKSSVKDSPLGLSLLRLF